MAQRGREVGKRESPVDRRLQSGLRNGCVHCKEIGARADVHAMNSQLFRKDRPDIELIGDASQHAYLRRRSPLPERPESSRKRRRPADFDDQVHALAAGLLKCPFFPIGASAVVQSRIQSQFFGAIELGVAA